jgi:hypothetical protein
MTDIIKGLREAVEHSERISLDDIDCTNVLAVIERLRAQVEEEKRLHACTLHAAEDAAREIDRLRDELAAERCLSFLDQVAALEAEITALREQEPFGWVYINDDDECEQFERGKPPPGWDVIQLYKAPVPSVPDVTDHLVAASAAVANQDDRAAQVLLGEGLVMLTAAKEKEND